MTVALVDNGSLEPAATRNLRAVAAELSASINFTVHPVSWKHSDRIPLAALDGDAPGTTLAPFVRAQLAAGERHFIFVPFFVSAQGAIGSSLRTDLEKLQHEHASAPTKSSEFTFAFTTSLSDSGVIAKIVAARVRETVSVAALERPPVIVVDHGGPSPASAALRNRLTEEVRALLGPDVSAVAAASMEGEEHAHNQPMLATQLCASGFDRGHVIVALLFLSPGRHAGPGGDIAQICGAAESAQPTLHCHLTDLIGTHPLVAPTLADALRATLSTIHAPLPA